MKKLRNNQLIFNADEHSYFVDKEEYLSVTSWVKSHFPDFDAARLAPYTAKAVRKEIASWDGTSPLVEKDFPKSARLFRENWQEEVQSRHNKKVPINAKEVKRIWKEYGQATSAEGTRIHALLEDYLNQELDLVDILEEPRVLVANTALQRYLNTLGYPEVHPEVRVFSRNFKLAGTVDLILETDAGVIIIDWKTNSSLDWKGRNRGLTEVTENLRDSNMQIYTLQLSTYAYILETEYGRDIKGLWLYHITEDDCIPIEVEYQRSLVEKMLKDEYLNNT